jgi:hypothetical protein
MKRKGHISKRVATQRNFEDAFWGYSDGKHGRYEVQRFESNLKDNLQNLLNAYVARSWRTSPYTSKEVFKPKHRIVQKSKVDDHVIQWASMLPEERWLQDTFYNRSPACVLGRGTHYYVRQEVAELRTFSQNELYYFVQLDIHHYFLNINHDLMKSRLREKLKDPVLLYLWDEFIDSFPGLVLGVKLSQLLSGLFLAPFDWLALKCFGIGNDVEKFHYWQNRYVTDCFLTCRTNEQAAELSKGVAYLKRKFSGFVREGLLHYSRFADNIVIKHEDKVFLHLMVELAIVTLSRDFLLNVNKNWNVRPTWMGNDLCGYVFFHDHLRLRKRNKKALCRQVAKLRKKGYSERDIRLKSASRAGFAYHADARNLLKSLNMEKRLGTVIKNRKKKAPFEGMTAEQKMSVEEIICYENSNENEKLIQLIDYKVDDSVIEKNDDGTPKRRIAIRYKRIDHIENVDAEEPTYVWGDKEYYSFSGSKVMIDQAEQDFSKEDLPLATVIKEFVNKQRKKFYKFT